MATANYEQGYDDNRFENTVSKNFYCVICFNVFKDPMMCKRNQHYFCRPCITRHLVISRTCPTCKEELSIETLNDVPRIVKDCLSELSIRCEYHDRGCREFVQLGNLENHVMDCGFSSVKCSNEGCLVTINKRDQIHHESEVCEFRKVKCHDCAETRKELDVIKKDLKTMNEHVMEMKVQLTEITGKLETLPEEIMHHTVKAKAEIAKSQVIVVGGGLSNSAEVFDISKRSWTRLQSTHVGRQAATSFVFENQMIVAGGHDFNNGPTHSMKSIHINEATHLEPWSDFFLKLPLALWGHATVVFNKRLVIIGGEEYTNMFNPSDGIYEVHLEHPYSTKLLTRMAQARFFHGAHLVNDQIIILGGRSDRGPDRALKSVISYDIFKNELKTLSPLPYAVYEMATVRLGDNIVIIGGDGKDGKALSSVVMYNVKTGKHYFLPEMKYERSGCVAVVVENNIMVIGGDHPEFKSVEMFNFTSYSWEDLPPMNEGRFRHTAVVW